VLHRLFLVLEESLGAHHPAVRCGPVAMYCAVEERKPPRCSRGLDAKVAAAVFAEGPFLQLDRFEVAALEMRDVTQAVQSLGGIAELRHTFETGLRRSPISRGKRLPTPTQEVIGSLRSHRPIIPAARVGDLMVEVRLLANSLT
jgi:hypothetical protein